MGLERQKMELCDARALSLGAEYTKQTDKREGKDASRTLSKVLTAAV